MQLLNLWIWSITSGQCMKCTNQPVSNLKRDGIKNLYSFTFSLLYFMLYFMAYFWMFCILLLLHILVLIVSHSPLCFWYYLLSGIKGWCNGGRGKPAAMDGICKSHLNAVRTESMWRWPGGTKRYTITPVTSYCSRCGIAGQWVCSAGISVISVFLL